MKETIADKFLGTWDLVSWTIETSDGKVIAPFGEDVSGQITYEINGLISILIMKNGRLPFQSPDPLEGRPDEVLSAWSGFIAYCGS
ncbi:MAG: lipocalin-like domain-containing protein [Lewinellaceae bacterium]|nr:lipocalin-like domain-containing protein [Saprospiraceae bacterium]MCB9268169.1 lipocalin-like domain-containing protein [Lewinellaceae bacterium]